MKKTKIVKTRVGIFKNMGENIPGGNFLGGNFLGRNFPGGSLMGGNFPGGSFADTKDFKFLLMSQIDIYWN